MIKPNEKTIKMGRRWLLYDTELMTEGVATFLNCDELQRKGLVVGSAGGRGETCFYKMANKTLALRHYLRGGLIAKLLHDQYFGLRLKNTRAWKEWHLLADMIGLGLPVPYPVAASVIKYGLFYRADLVTVYIENTKTLAERLKKESLSDEVWQRIGLCIKEFHQHSVWHSDLNANNILLDQNNKVYLIDFDRCGFLKGDDWKQGNLDRLKRSLNKFKNKLQSFNFDQNGWDHLMTGYTVS